MLMRPIGLGLLSSVVILLWTAGDSPSMANDSSAELSVGGLVFTHSADVSLVTEDLAISPDIVTVRYRFLNQSPKPVTLTVAFPVPDLDLSEGDNYAIPSSNDSSNFLGFTTKVDGQPIDLIIHQSAFLGSQDISATLKKLNVPLLPIGARQTILSDLPEAVREQLFKQGLLLPNGNDERGRQLYEAAWTVKTAAMRQQTFPPNHPVLVEHRYHTSVGIRFDTVLRKGLRQNKAMASEIERYRKDYCVSDAFLAALDKLAGSGEANSMKVQERRISYILKTGANWAGPIKDFRLTIDKQKPDRLVSFCAQHIKTISPTVLEFAAKDFTPDKDLKILIVGRF
jgi:hypothetical protein